MVDEDKALVQRDRFIADLLVDRAIAAVGLQNLLVEAQVAGVHHNRAATLSPSEKKVASGVLLDHPGHSFVSGNLKAGLGVIPLGGDRSFGRPGVGSLDQGDHRLPQPVQPLAPRGCG